MYDRLTQDKSAKDIYMPFIFIFVTYRLSNIQILTKKYDKLVKYF